MRRPDASDRKLAAVSLSPISSAISASESSRSAALQSWSAPRRGSSVMSPFYHGSAPPQGYPCSVVGSMIVPTAATTVAGNPLRSVYSSINAASFRDIDAERSVARDVAVLPPDVLAFGLHRAEHTVGLPCGTLERLAIGRSDFWNCSIDDTTLHVRSSGWWVPDRTAPTNPPRTERDRLRAAVGTRRGQARCLPLFRPCEPSTPAAMSSVNCRGPDPWDRGL